MKEKIKKIKVLAMDVDGVLTDGKIIIDSHGGEIKNFNVYDGYGLAFVRRAGIKTAIITARSSRPVLVRGRDLKIDRIYQDAYPKDGAYRQMLKDFGVKDQEVCFVGDDLPDLDILQHVGFAVAVANAVPEVKQQADYVTKRHGGDGAIREVIELILKIQNKWVLATRRKAGLLKTLVVLGACLSGLGTYAFCEEPAQKFQGFNLAGYTDTGEKAWDVNGEAADIQGDTIEITNVDANRFGEGDVNLKAKHGTVDKINGNIQLKDDVVITSKEGGQLQTESLNWEKGKDLVTTKDDVTLTGDGMTATGTGLTAHPGLKTAQMDKNVTVKVNAEPKNPAGRLVTITSDGPMEVDQVKQMATFQDRVVAVQDQYTLKADRMEVYFDPQTKQIAQTICIGNVVIEQGENRSYAQKAVYSSATQKLTLTGRPKLIMVTEGGNNPFGGSKVPDVKE
jgi:3-deoxy-D-manno-octulosonate 8-phosphate phosphatase (KDO 8-P phosphatase)